MDQELLQQILNEAELVHMWLIETSYASVRSVGLGTVINREVSHEFQQIRNWTQDGVRLLYEVKFVACIQD
jgi:hypothetical protein